LARLRPVRRRAVGTVKQMIQNGHEAGPGHGQFW